MSQQTRQGTEQQGDLAYLTGFANDFASEALAGALPTGRNSPQKPAFGLYAEKISGTAFTAPRGKNRRSWLYRIRPSVVHGRFRPIDRGLIRHAPAGEIDCPPDQLRWDPLPIPDRPTDFVDGLVTVACNGDLRAQTGIAIHQYLANASMSDRYFYNSDGELLLVPQQGRVSLLTEMGPMSISPGEIAVLPRGIRFQVLLPDGPSRGFVCENYGALLDLPERGPIGFDGLANERDFLSPQADFDTREGEFTLVTKLGGKLFEATIGHCPLDVVAWHGNLAPYKYDLNRFNTMGSISFDHPDPSIFTVLTSQSDTPGTANVDFVIFPPRWLVMEDTFRPPWYHRNIMSEYMGLIYGQYDAKPGAGFAPGGSSLHNCMQPHGPDTDAFAAATGAALAPQKLADTMAFMFESRYLIEPTRFAMESPARQTDYLDCWRGLKARFERP